jgi:hypothetical protein
MALDAMVFGTVARLALKRDDQYSGPHSPLTAAFSPSREESAAPVALRVKRRARPFRCWRGTPKEPARCLAEASQPRYTRRRQTRPVNAA